MVASLLFDSILIAGVAISVHYSLVQYFDMKKPPPKFVLDAVNLTGSMFGMEASKDGEQIEDAGDYIQRVETRALGDARTFRRIHFLE